MSDRDTKEMNKLSENAENAPYEQADESDALPPIAASAPSRIAVFIAAIIIAAAAGAAAMMVRLSDVTSEPTIRYETTVSGYFAATDIPAVSAAVTSADGSEDGNISDVGETFSYPADINSASFECLSAVNGINRSVAQGIVDYRKAHGLIHDFNELLDIYGIGERTLSIIEEHFYISEQDRLPAVTTLSSSVTEPPPSSASTAASSAPDKVFTYPADINTASFECLVAVSGINRTAAEGIIKYREAHERIHDLNELLDIYGIGERTLSVIKEHFYISEKDRIPAVTTLPADVTVSSSALVTTAALQTTTAPKTTTVTAATTAEPVMRLVNINTATAEELAEGLLIDPEIAKAIVELRSKIGEFVNDLELLYVDGFSETMLVERREFICL